MISRATSHPKVVELPGNDPGFDRLMRRHPMARAIVPAWEELAGWTNLNLALLGPEGPVAGLILSVQRVPYMAVALSRINALMIDPADLQGTLAPLLAAVEGYARRHLILETEIRVRLPINPGAPGASAHRAIWEALEQAGYGALQKADTSYYVAIDRDEEVMIASFDRSARNKIRKAQRSGAVIEQSKDFALLDDFYSAYLDMCSRKQAPVQPETLVGRGLRPLLERGHALLFVERYEAGISNLVIVDVLGTPCYVLGTRTQANVRGQVPGAAQVLQFEIMQHLRALGHRYYDLGGCEGPVPIEGHPNFGVWRFKYGFQPEFVRFIPYLRKVRGPFGPALRLAHQLRGDHV